MKLQHNPFYNFRSNSHFSFLLGLGLGLNFKAYVVLYLEGVKDESAGLGRTDSKTG